MSTDKRLAIIATKGTLDWAYPPFILASTAGSLGYEARIFFTFYGLQLLRKSPRLQISSLGNPGMPMPMPVPVLLQAMPGMQSVMTAMMKRRMRTKGIASVESLRDLCIEAGVGLIACQMTVDLFDLRPEDLIEGIDYAGAATFFEFAGRSDICLFI